MSILSGLESKHKLFFLVFFLSITAIVSAIFSDEKTYAIYIGFFSLFVMWLTKPIWLPDGYGKNKVRLYSLFIALVVGASSLYGAWYVEISEKIVQSVPEEWSFLAEFIQKIPPAAPSISVMFFILCVVAVVNYTMSQQSIMGEHQSDFDRDIPEPEFDERLGYALDALKDDIYSIDKQINRRTGAGVFLPHLKQRFI